ncbi:hypothetical protein GY21_20640 [Cryobacterium roopkundense]|uniref:Phospholipase/carboxylesterase n=1 Tax=Cryobacterium roopkundense TaxID=1001240 RepID=A0A099J0A6_9MICO|nr:alpha/beta hydrolase [Cryobacterium roopkundense]KGJ71661.1 hypothetical protein GY21_20640 [Cryobacterium roopkundense]MBB5639962.1 phospholipase/carboxylesterase [Cryobacterium roopkundense]
MTESDTFRNWPHVFRAGSATAPVLLMLHGTGGNEEEIARLADSLDPDATVLAPRGRVIEGGMLRWFRRISEGVFDVDDVVLRSAELVVFLAGARAHYGLGERPVVAVGFSNGANIALATALLHPEAIAGVVAFSGMFPLTGRDVTADLSGTGVLLLNGRSDPMAPLASVTVLAAALAAAGAEVEQHVRDGGHGVTQPDVVAAQSWLARRGPVTG